MKRIALILAAFACLQIVAWAAPDSVTTGPYNISFDLGMPKNAYTASVSEPKMTESLSGDLETEYQIEIQNRIDKARIISISMTYTKIESPKSLMSPDEMEAVVRAVMLKYRQPLTMVNSAQRIIDNTTGAAGSYYYKDDIEVFTAMYYPQCENGSLLCTIMSDYPWDEGTLQLLKTIHIEKINTTA